MEQITEMSREIEGLELENEVFRNYLERTIHDQPDGEEIPTEGKKVRHPCIDVLILLPGF